MASNSDTWEDFFKDGIPADDGSVSYWPFDELDGATNFCLNNDSTYVETSTSLEPVIEIQHDLSDCTNQQSIPSHPTSSIDAIEQGFSSMSLLEK